MNDPVKPADALERTTHLLNFLKTCDANTGNAQTLPWSASAQLCEYIAPLGIEEIITAVDTLKQRDGEARSIALYQIWLQFNNGRNEQCYAIWYNLGVQYSTAGRVAEAITAFRSALAIKPDLYQAAVNLGLTYEKAGRPDAALNTWQNALQPDEARIALFNQKARLLESLKRYGEAEEALVSSLRLDPHQPDAIHHWISIRTKTCTWPVYDGLAANLSKAAMIQSTSSLGLLSLFDDVDLQSKLNASYIGRKFPPAPARLRQARGYGHEKIRVGYLSSDYGRHPMAYLVTALFETHDRSRFDVYGYCAAKDDGSLERARIARAFDRFVSVRDLDDKSAAHVIRADEIDILVDLNGLTFGSRLGVLSWRPAPVQVTYLGYNGPVPMPELDYILADPYVIPAALKDRYHPKPLWLPRCYQANDSSIPVAAAGTRFEAGLPEDQFIFCCFSNNYKITEEMFRAWMEILRRVPQSVLWIYADNSNAHKNLTSYAALQGIAPERLIFAERVEPEVYRARLALADLFLDTFPYNAGTTASDALRAGLPIVTLSGQTFISRMAGSLLRTIGLEEGITASLPAYIELAAGLALDRDRYESFRAKADPAAWARTLGDTPKFTRELEDIYASIAINAGAQRHP